MKKLLPLIFILLLGAILRLWMLGVIPKGITNDEMGYVYNAYSIAKTGKNIFGEVLPFLTWVNKGGTPFLPVPTYFTAPFFLIFSLSPFVARLPSAILGILDIFLLFTLVNMLFKNRNLALISALFLAISPWHLHFSRVLYDTNFGLFFFLLGTVAFIYEIRRERLPIISLLSLFLAIYSFRGMNILFFPLSLLLVWFGYYDLKIKKKQLVVFISGVILIACSLLLVILLNGSKYTSEAGRFFDSQKAMMDVDIQAKEAQGPLFIKRIFLNKLTYAVDNLRSNYINAFSPGFLFLNGESTQIYSINTRGRIYFIDSLFIILGLFYLFKINKKSSLFLILLLFSAALPAAVSGTPYSARDFFMSLIFPIFSAGGVMLITQVKRLDIKVLLLALVAFIYLYSFSSYLFDYYERFAFYSAEPWFKSLKDISSIVLREKNNYDEVIVGTSSFQDELQYAFYSKTNPLDVQKSWKQSLKDGDGSYKLNKVQFLEQCYEGSADGKPPVFRGYRKVVYIVHEGCGVYIPSRAEVKDYFGNIVWKVYSIDYAKS